MDDNILLFNELQTMRKEHREDHKTLLEKIDEGFTANASTMASHELRDESRFAAVDKRLSVVENTRRTIVWLTGACIVAALGAAAELIVVLLGKHP